MTKIAVIYHSATGHVHKLAEALANGAAGAGAEVRRGRVAELAPEEVIRGQYAWHEQNIAAASSFRHVTMEDLEWATDSPLEARLAQYASLLVVGRRSVRPPRNGSPSTAEHREGGSFDPARPVVKTPSNPLDLDPYSPAPPSRSAGQARSASP